MTSADSPDPGQAPADSAPRARLGVRWIDPTHVEEFLRQTLQDSTITVRYTEASGWAVEGGRRGGDLSRSVWGTPEVCAEEIAHLLLNSPLSSVWSRKEVRQKAEQLEQRFDAWIWETPELAESAKRRYNELFSAEVHTFPNINRPFSDLRSAFPARRPPIFLHKVGPGKDPKMVLGSSAPLSIPRAAAPGFPTGVTARIQKAMQEFIAPPPEAASSKDQSAER